MRTSDSLKRIAAGLAALVLSAAAALAQSDAAPADAYVKGMQAYRAGDARTALALLDKAATEGYFLAEYRLARIYSNPRSGYTDDAAAFRLFEKIAAVSRDIDPYLDARAPYVARALVALARYQLAGVPELSLAADPAAARDRLEIAASYFDNPDAQFELAKLSLTENASPEAVSSGLHWLSTLAEKRDHVGAQAYLVDRFWNGSHVARRPALGLALVTIALSAAPAEERIWIEELYHRIYCSAREAVRGRAEVIVTKWYADRAERGLAAPASDDPATEADSEAFKDFDSATRSCANGELITLPAHGGRQLLPAGESPGVMDEVPSGAGETVAASGVSKDVDGDGVFDGAMSLGLTSETPVPGQ